MTLVSFLKVWRHMRFVTKFGCHLSIWGGRGRERDMNARYKTRENPNTWKYVLLWSMDCKPASIQLYK